MHATSVAIRFFGAALLLSLLAGNASAGRYQTRYRTQRFFGRASVPRHDFAPQYVPPPVLPSPAIPAGPHIQVVAPKAAT